MIDATPPGGPPLRRLARGLVRALVALAALAGGVAAAACGGPGAGGDPPPPYVESGDLAAIGERGYLRVLMPPQRPRALERRALPLEVDRRVAEELARDLGLVPWIVYVDDRETLLAALAAGHGDLAVGRFRPTPQLAERLDFSVAVDHVREMVVVGEDREGEIEGPADLAGLRVVVPRGSQALASLEALALEVPDVEVVEAPPGTDDAALLELVADDEADATVADEDLLEAVLPGADDLVVAFPLGEEQPVAWALREGSPQLKEAVDGHLTRSALTAETDEPYRADLDEIRRRGVLRVLTRNNSATYFLYRGEQMGFDYELARRFARRLGVRVQVVVPRQPGQLVDWLLDGRGDLIAASMTVDPARQERVEFTRPYAQASELVVVPADRGVDEPADLAGKTVAVQRSSAHYPRLVELRRRVDFVVEEAPEEMETDGLIAAVAEGRYDATVVDSNMLDVELTWRDDVESGFPLGEPLDVAWAVPPGAEALHAAADEFLADQRGTSFFNTLKTKYFTDRRTVARQARAAVVGRGRLSPYDALFRTHAARADLDWRLLASQAYQESRFDPTARSWAGAVGLMQVMPRTARHMGVRGNLRDPAVSVSAGVSYMGWLLERFGAELPFAERLLFALASYNAGRGHILDGRRLASEHGYDPDVWFGNVERVLPLLEKRSVARRARYGYCRCTEPVAYVDAIHQRYLAYADIEELGRGRGEEGESEGRTE
jgi:membrane-bound lytic murein transglycosylase F